MSIYICSDIHGHYELYQKIPLQADDTLYILGDLIDRGPDSMGLLLDVMKKENVICLLGNHELFMWEHIKEGMELSSWMLGRNGGQETFDAYRKLPAEDQDRIMEFLEGLYLQVELETGGRKVLLSHSAFLSETGTVKWKEASYRDAFRTVWYSPWRVREFFPPEAYQKDGRLHIIGHVPVQHINRDRAYVDPENHLINIDLGCAINYGLCVLNLDAYLTGREDTFTYYLTDETMQAQHTQSPSD